VAAFVRTTICLAVCALVGVTWVHAQNRGVYPLGMTVTNSGLTPASGFTYSNQLLFYGRDASKDDDGRTVQTGTNTVVMDMNAFVWVSEKTMLGGARYSASATLPVARNNLASDVHGNISGGSGVADSYYVPVILGWTRDRMAVRALYGFLAPTGRFDAAATDNVGSGYWTSTLSSGQTVYLTADKRLAVSAFEMYEFHTEQSGTGTRPGDTFDLDYSLMRTFAGPAPWRTEIGVVGYEARQTTATTGPSIAPDASRTRYAVHAIGAAAQFARLRPGFTLGARYFKEFANRSTFQGFSAQFFGAITF
jgi:hypothetical protein